MTQENKQNNLYQCKECGFHYKDKETAEKCEAWCKEHKTCNVEITREAEENKAPQRDPQRDPASLVELEGKCEEYLNNWKRAQADFENYKKDESERIGVLLRYAKEDMILNILPIIDNIELAEKQLPEKLKKPSLAKASEGQGEGKFSDKAVEWTRGFLQIKKQIEEFLKKEGIEEIQTRNPSTGSELEFNPETMEAVSEIPNTQFPIPNTVVEELQKGYIMDGKVIRPAKVKVTK